MIDNQRIISLVSFLKENKRIRNQQDFVERIGSDKSTVSQILGGKLSVPNNMFEKIHNAFPDISLSWLVTGEGDMLKFEGAEDKEPDGTQPQGIPHIEQVDAWCGKGQGFEVSVMRKDCPVYNIPGAEDADFTIRAKGRSMINRQHPARSINEGDYLACRKQRTNIIRYGEIYALATSDGVMVKVVQPGKEEGTLLLESFNTEEGFQPFSYPVIDIHDMALVIAVASINRLA